MDPGDDGVDLGPVDGTFADEFEEAYTSKKRSYADAGLDDGAPAKKPMTEDYLDVHQQPISTLGSSHPPPLAPPSGSGNKATQEVAVSESLMGMVMGKGGETIRRLQSESGARIQTGEAGQGSERILTITGDAENVVKARMLLEQLLNESGASGRPKTASSSGPVMTVSNSAAAAGTDIFDMMLPANKVGLVIGKGGETIKRLQAESGCVMFVVQDGPSPGEKPLRIQGTPQTIEHARVLVNELLNSSDMPPGANAPGLRMDVPREVVGVVIGRGGENVRRIHNETGVRIQFQPDSGEKTRTAVLSGPAENLAAAQKIILDVMSERNQGGSGGSSIPNAGGSGGNVQEVQFPVPANQCGLVIGRGGETIRQLKQQSGCHIELNRNIVTSPDLKVFILRGSDSAISHAQQLIREKCNAGPGGSNQQRSNDHGGPMGGPPHMGGPHIRPPGGPMFGGHGAPPMYPNPYAGGVPPGAGPGGAGPGGAPGADASSAWAAYYQHYYQQYSAQQAAAAAAAAAAA
eukprot:scpid75486/ scgid33905/ Far upstream element-binding protein 1; DNA helicase V